MTIVEAIRRGMMDAELAALLWLLASAGVPVHVAAEDAAAGDDLANAVRALARDPAGVSTGRGSRLEDVMRQPVPLRPATGAVLVLSGGRVVAAHVHRRPLRDAGGHVRPQGPAVLATWDAELGAWEHFAWGITPELAEAAGRRAGDFEIELGRRREHLETLVGSGLADAAEVARALRGYGVRSTLS